jgi:hypothetical protein
MATVNIGLVRMNMCLINALDFVVVFSYHLGA